MTTLTAYILSTPIIWGDHCAFSKIGDGDISPLVPPLWPMWISNGERILTICLLVSTQHRRVSDSHILT